MKHDFDYGPICRLTFLWKIPFVTDGTFENNPSDKTTMVPHLSNVTTAESFVKRGKKCVLDMVPLNRPVKFADFMLMDLERIRFLAPTEFMNQERIYNFLEDRFGVLGIIAFSPPEGMVPTLLDSQLSGIEAWGTLKNIVRVNEWGQRFARKLSTNLYESVVNREQKSQTLREFMMQAKADGYFEPHSSDVDECCNLFWKRIEEIEHETFEEAMKDQLFFSRCAYNYDGSVFKLFAHNFPVSIFS